VYQRERDQIKPKLLSMNKPHFADAAQQWADKQAANGEA
jgi:hypothetical protein